ncbi:MAG: ATP-binding cassette domain-containing protein [Treponema sp.]|jgi:nickel transport system ATP-binding protein|nr:ATP-binding cassette domain-containing protein [Treponema sp.]
MTTLIELRDIRKSYRQGKLFRKSRNVEILHGIDLSIYRGQCLGLLGESGCGKSTTARIVLGLEKSEGGVFYKGNDIWKMDKEAYRVFRRNAQVVFQNSQGAVNPRFRAWEIVTEPLSYLENPSREDLRSRARELLVRVGIDSGAMDKLPSQFSGGELQRICIARAMALKPEFIVLDEAVSALDMLNQSLVLDLIRELKKESGAAFLFISHDLRVLLKICDSLAVMQGGCITSRIEDLSCPEKTETPSDPVFMDLAAAVLPAEPQSA